MKTEESFSRRFARYIRAPIRALCRARDMYVKSMTECANRIDYGAAVIGCPATVVYTLPRSYSTNSMRRSEDHEIRDLIRVLAMKETAEETKKKNTMNPTRAAVGVMTTRATPTKSKEMVKSVSMEIGRIDEDKPCYFPHDFKVGSTKPPAYSRSKSYAARRRNGSFSLG